MRAADILSSQIVDYKTNIIRQRMKDYYRTLKQGKINLPEWLDPDFIGIDKHIERIKQDGNAFHKLFSDLLS
jgi:hypothetical protein